MGNQQSFDDEIDLREYIDVVIRRWKIIVIFTIVCGLIAFGYSKMQKPVYEGSATILLRSGTSSSASQYAGLAGMLGINLNASGGNIGDLTELIKSRAVALKVLKDLSLRNRIKGWDNADIRDEELAGAVSSMLKPAKSNGNVLEIKTESSDPKLAADVANGYISAIGYYWSELNYTEAQKKLKYISDELPKIEESLKISENRLKLVPRSSTGLSLAGQSNIQRDYDIYSSVYTMLKKEYESTKLDASKELPPFSIVDSALTPKSPVRPKTKLNVMMGLVLGAFLGVFYAFFQEYWTKTDGS